MPTRGAEVGRVQVIAKSEVGKLDLTLSVSVVRDMLRQFEVEPLSREVLQHLAIEILDRMPAATARRKGDDGGASLAAILTVAIALHLQGADGDRLRAAAAETVRRTARLVVVVRLEPDGMLAVSVADAVARVHLPGARIADLDLARAVAEVGR